MQRTLASAERTQSSLPNRTIPTISSFRNVPARHLIRSTRREANRIRDITVDDNRHVLPEAG